MRSLKLMNCGNFIKNKNFENLRK